MNTKTILHYPRLDTVLMVEEHLKKSLEEKSKNNLFRTLPRQVQYQTLQVILDYLEQSNKIVYSKGKIVWIGSNKKVDKLIKKGKEY
jgi:hypothetical protein